MLDKIFTDDDINSVVHGPKTISCLRVALLCDCFNLFIKFCNAITVSASLKERHNIYRRLYISMMQSKNLSSSMQSGNITGKKALHKSECYSNLEDWKDFILSYRRASKGLRSITSKWKFFSHDIFKYGMSHIYRLQLVMSKQTNRSNRLELQLV